MHPTVTTVISLVSVLMSIFLRPKTAKLPSKGTYRNSGYDTQTHRIDGSNSATRGSIIDYESHKITTTTQSTTVAELNALMKCFWNLFVFACTLGRHQW